MNAKSNAMKTNRISSLLHRRKLLVALLSLIAAVAVTTSIAQQRDKQKVAGKCTLTLTKQEEVEVGDTEGHTLGIGVWEGTNVSTGFHPFMDGAKIVVMGFGDLVQGTGPDQGYSRTIKDGDAVFTRYSGKNTATWRGGAITEATFEGKFSYISGKGRFQGIQGGATYKGKFIDKKTAIVESEGEYTIKK